MTMSPFRSVASSSRRTGALGGGRNREPMCFSGDVSYKGQMFFRMSMIRFVYDESDWTKWVEKIVLDENDGNEDFESSNFDPLSHEPARVPPHTYGLCICTR